MVTAWHLQQLCATVVKNNKPVLLITLSGTIPIKKVKQVCNINYSITKFGNTQKGYEYYPSLGPPEASDVAYIGYEPFSIT